MKIIDETAKVVFILYKLELCRKAACFQALLIDRSFYYEYVFLLVCKTKQAWLEGKKCLLGTKSKIQSLFMHRISSVMIWTVA